MGATDQAGNLHNRIRMSAMSEEGSLLEELRTAYRGLGRKERQQVKTLLLTLGRATADLLGTETATIVPLRSTKVSRELNWKMRPATQKRIKTLMVWGFHKAGDVEERLGYYIGQLGR